MASEIELLCQLLKMRILTCSGFLSLPEIVPVATSLKLINILILQALDLSQSSLQRNKLGFLVRIVKRRQ